MAIRIGLIRCEKNEASCPLTSCLKSLQAGTQAFALHSGECELVGVFTCRCPGNRIVDQARILKAKGADVIHLCTCIFAGKQDGAWLEDKGFCANPEQVAVRSAVASGIPCILGTAHLPRGYHPLVVPPHT
ncbi:MAG: CGGC domain-containing protein [Desulfohalobiaceae bacterium]